MADDGLSPGSALFVCGCVTGLCFLAAGLAYSAAPGVRTAAVLAMAFAGLTGVVLLAGLVTAGAFRGAGRHAGGER